MRPRIRVGIYTRKEIDRSIWKMVLETAGYATFCYTGHEETPKACAIDSVRCLLIVMRYEDNAETIISEIDDLSSDVRPKILVINKRGKLTGDQLEFFTARCSLRTGRTKTSEILGLVKDLTVLARGPKPLNAGALRVIEAARA